MKANPNRCRLPRCEKKVKRGDNLCSMHRSRWTRTGRFDKKSYAEKLLERSIKTASGCLEFQGYRNKLGYGKIRANGKKMLAHRLAFEAWSAQPIPKGMLVCHYCDNPPCINFNHLFLGTDLDNARDAMRKGRRHVKAT